MGKSKIRDRWSPEVYRVVTQPYKGLPVYKVSPVSGEGRSRIVHRNLLLPCSCAEDQKGSEQESGSDSSNRKADSFEPNKVRGTEPGKGLQAQGSPQQGVDQVNDPPSLVENQQQLRRSPRLRARLRWVRVRDPMCLASSLPESTNKD